MKFKKVNFAFSRASVLVLSACSLMSCGILNKKSSGEVQPISETAPEDVMTQGIEDQSCSQSTALTEAKVWQWDGSAVNQQTVALNTRVDSDQALTSDGVLGAIRDFRYESDCTVANDDEIDCGDSRITSKGSIVNICRPNGAYSRDSIEGITLTSQHFVGRAWKAYDALPSHKSKLTDAVLVILPIETKHYSKGDRKKTLVSSDNAAFGAPKKSSSPGIFMVYPTSITAFNKSPVHLWEVPFVMTHEYGHNVFNHHVGTALAAVSLNIFKTISLDHILPVHSDIPTDTLGLTTKDRSEQAMGGINEMFADLFAYFVNGGAPNQLKGVSSLEGTRDPGNALTKAGTPKKWGKRQLDVFEGRASAERSLENGDPTFTGVHDVAAFLSYPMAKLLSDSLPGADATKKLDTLVRWLDAISAKLVKTRSPELSLDQLTALLVETIVAGKTADAKEFGSACSEFKLLVEGLEKTAAACK